MGGVCHDASLLGLGLLAGHILAAMFADLGPLLDNFRTKRAFAGEKPLMNFAHRSVDLFLKLLVAELQISYGLDGLQFADVADHLGGLQPDSHRFGRIHEKP